MSVILSALACVAAEAGESGIEGQWKREDGNALVRIAPCGKDICATNLWIRDTSRGEEVGDKLVMSLTPDDANTYSGNAYDPKRKLNYSIVVTARKGGLVTRGCFVGKMICKDVSWTAAN
ncbi:DUF2147 domain-containing protein [Mesorhizobium sp. VNQ89]|uniref:DUF2147 domain-containing protein n=1 Tax=Mesorhizobium quangtriensis TaxID=3157709 RepID=UPI0032B736A2